MRMSFVCSLMEQKTDWLKGSSADIMRKLEEREDSAQDIKKCVFVGIYPLMYLLLDHSILYFSLCWVYSLLEQQVEQLSEMTAQKLSEREGSAQQIKRCLL